jgi:hypothetical protein
MRVRIVAAPRGVVDGIEVELFQVGSAYDLSPALAGVLLLEGWAVPDQREHDGGRNFADHLPPRVRNLDKVS